LARSKRLACEVAFLGKQDSISEILSIADLMLLPSETESFGLVALEAMACEVPVIASKVGGLPEVVRDGQDGYLSEPRDVNTMAAKAIAVLSDEEKRQAMGMSARQHALRNFCSDKIIVQYERYYEEVMDNVHSGHH
jgi:L-malate glycosyltransferase